jgi:hypothetical protein
VNFSHKNREFCDIIFFSQKYFSQTGENSPHQKTMGLWHNGLGIYIKKYLNAKEELRKLKYFTMQKYNLQKLL